MEEGMRKSVFQLGLSLPFIISGCGALEIYEKSKQSSYIEEKNYPIEDFYVDEFGLSTSSGKVSFTDDADLFVNSKSRCRVEKGTKIEFFAISKVKSGFRNIIFSDSEQTCGIKEAYVNHDLVEVFFEGSYSLTTSSQTYFKVSTAQSSTLNMGSQKCLIQKDSKLYMNDPAELNPDKVHVNVTLKDKLEGCDFTEGVFYRPHLSSISMSEKEQDNSFNNVIKHILKWEGGCSDHPNDPGGRTFMGITTERARLNNYTGDVCEMPYSMVLEIYKKDYWQNRAAYYAWPLDLAIMNTEVNSGGGRARQFLDRMSANQIDGSTVEKASWFVDQQTDFYYLIADRNPNLRVFLRGWVNRSNYMQDVIWQRLSLGYNFESTAKTTP